MVEASATEIAIASVFILLLGTVLSVTGYLEDAIPLFVFMTMGLIGFLAMRAIRGRKFDWR
jgi:hypothetical protein